MNMDDQTYKPEIEHKIPWELDIENPARNAGMPFQSLVTFASGCWAHEKMIKDGGEDYKKIKTPIQITYGDCDEVVCMDTIKQVFEALPEKKMLICLENADHNPHWEKQHWESITQSSDIWF